MQPETFRKIALGFPEAREDAHMGHPDFRVSGKIFASLGYPDDAFGMVVLTAKEQAKFIREHPAVFSAAKGAWGRHGSTIVRLENVKTPLLRQALAAAWRKRAPAASR